MTTKRDRLIFILQDYKRSHEAGYKVMCYDIVCEWVAYAVAEHLGRPSAIAQDNKWHFEELASDITWDKPMEFSQIYDYVEQIAKEQAIKETKNVIKNTDSSE
jgi:hypothetical protein